MTTHRTYPYASTRLELTHGLGRQLDDLVPRPIRDAEDRMTACRNRAVLAEETLGRLVRQLEDRRTADAKELGQAIAAGKAEPKRPNYTEAEAEITAARLEVDACRHAILAARERLFAALNTAKADGTLAAAVAALTARSDEAVAELRQTVATLKAKRDAAVNDLSLARVLDAFPNHSADPNYTPPLGDVDAFMTAETNIARDLDYLSEARPLSLLPPEAESA